MNVFGLQIKIIFSSFSVLFFLLKREFQMNEWNDDDNFTDAINEYIFSLKCQFCVFST